MNNTTLFIAYGTEGFDYEGETDALLLATADRDQAEAACWSFLYDNDAVDGNDADSICYHTARVDEVLVGQHNGARTVWRACDEIRALRREREANRLREVNREAQANALAWWHWDLEQQLSARRQ